MLREHRGKVIYIPIVVPDNLFVGLGHVLGVAAGILLICCAASQQWYSMSVVVPPSSPYDPMLTGTLTFGLRSMHITYCETYNASVLGTKEYDGCGFEDVFYTSCSSTNDWCASHGNTAFTFAIMIVDAIFVAATCGMALVRLGLLPTGFMISAWIALLSVMSFRQESVLFEPSQILSSWMEAGTTQDRFLWAYFGCISCVFLLSCAVILSTYGYIRAGREDALRDSDRRREEEQARHHQNAAVDSGAVVDREALPSNFRP